MHINCGMHIIKPNMLGLILSDGHLTSPELHNFGDL